ncbi:MAG: urate hydroxylase PuuD, partial [Bradymonadaceae bacterium]
ATWGHTYNWAILAGIAICGAAVRHWFNLKGRGELNFWILPAAAVGIVSLGFVTAPNFNPFEKPPAYKTYDKKVSFEEAQSIIANRCVQCHSENPSDDVWQTPPAGVKLETPEQIKQYAERIKVRVAEQKTMPFNNKTNITEEERIKLGA